LEKFSREAECAVGIERSVMIIYKVRIFGGGGHVLHVE
jgi:hypothetical protein